jgi:signal peptidase I
MMGPEARQALQLAQVVSFLWLFERHVLSMTLAQGPSMQPTLRAQGDVLLLDRAYPSPAQPLARGDVVVCDSSYQEHYSIVKRVVGLPGDELLRPEWAAPYVVPPGHVWLEGDNAANSMDSRHYGAIPSALVRGRVAAVAWPPWLCRAVPRGGAPPAPSATALLPRGSAAAAAAAAAAEEEREGCQALLAALRGAGVDAEALAEVEGERAALELAGGGGGGYAGVAERLRSAQWAWGALLAPPPPPPPPQPPLA